MNYQLKPSFNTSTANSNHNLHTTRNSAADEDFTTYITPARIRCMRAVKDLSEEAINSITEVIESIESDLKY